jgi:hypothetical protein
LESRNLERTGLVVTMKESGWRHDQEWDTLER